jgi:hypothetical protein
LCRLPFDHLFINNAGVIHACCIAYPQYTKLDEFGNPTEDRNVSTQGLKSAWNAASLRALRQKMQLSQWPKVCEVCQRQEASGLPSRRTREGLRDVHGDVHGDVPPMIRSLDIRLGNACNLSCRMCSPFSSRALITEWSDPSPELPKASQIMQEAVQALNRSQSPAWEEEGKFWQALAEFAPRAQDIHFAGGEPFLNRAHLKFLESLIASGQSHSTQLSYNTNLTLIPSWLEQVASEFANVRIMISLDGVKDVAEYIRYPIKWPQFLDSLGELNDLMSRLPNKITAVFNTTLQVYTMAGIWDLIKFLENHSYKNLPHETVGNILHNPPYFDLAEMPVTQKEAAIRYLDNVRQKVSLPSSRSLLEMIIKQISASPRTDPSLSWGQFLQVSKRYDLQRKQDLAKLESDVFQILDITHSHTSI